jgi:hypothetical protein
MDPSLIREMMCRQAVALVVVLVSVVSSRLKRRRPAYDSEPDPLARALRDEAEQHRQHTLNLIFNYSDAECLAMLRMTRVPFFPYAICLEPGT